VQAVPLGFTKTLTAVALAKGIGASASTLILMKGILKLMAVAKMKTAAAVAAGVLILTASTVTAVLVVDDYVKNLHFSNKFVQELQKAPPVLMIQETHFPRKVDDSGSAVVGDKMIGRNQLLDSMIRCAYLKKPWKDKLTIFPADWTDHAPTNRYDYMVTVEDHPLEKFQELIRQKFGYTGHLEKLKTNWFALRVVSPRWSEGKNDQ
jgi:hypothetical protein